MEGTNAAGIASNPAGESIHTSMVVYDSLGTPVTVDVTAVLESKANSGNTWRYFATSGDDTDVGTALATGTLEFDTQGLLKQVNGDAITVNRDATGAKEPLTFRLKFDGVTSLTAQESAIAMTGQDGYQVGVLNSFSIGADGRIIGAYSNGQSKELGQIAVATFANNQGLVDRGSNQFTMGADSGVPVVSAPQKLGAGVDPRVVAGAEQRRPVEGVREHDHQLDRVLGRQPGDHDQRPAHHRAAELDPVSPAAEPR
jgi:flagellar hook protein FlgE